ncbi:MAG TPA: hypothetical protein VEW28_11040 [Candidatus Kapabacteria bacterium]|nr:hypothetical protein [Candidatus Kapabacteria bacterium]
MMKYSARFLSLCLTALAVFGVMVLSSCKDNAPDPGYVNYAQFRAMEFVQQTPIQVFMYRADNIADTEFVTQTALTYGVSTVYQNNIPTARGAGQLYHCVAIVAGTSNPAIVVATTDVTLFPGDKQTWVIYDKDPSSGQYPSAVLNDNTPSGNSNTLAYFRFINTTPPSSPNLQNIHLMVGDPWHGLEITPTGGVPFKAVTSYKGLPVAKDTTVTFYVTDNTSPVPVILGRLAGIALQGGTYHTVTWGGQLDQNSRKIDNNGNHVLDDTVRIHLFDDNQLGNDQLPVPQTLRFNFVNALMPSTIHSPAFVDYTLAATQMSLVINNNTVYDAQGLAPFSTYAAPYNVTSDGVLQVVPKTVPLTGLVYVKCVKAYGAGQNPSPSDSILFRFYANSQLIKSDQLYSLVVFDTVKKQNPTAAAPYDSSAGVTTIPIPDQPEPGAGAIIVVANTVSSYKATGTSVTAANASISVNGTTLTKVVAPKTFDKSIQPVGPVTIAGSLNNKTETVPSVTFNAVAGGIYEVLLVGDRGRPDGNYKPHFMVILTNPIQ